MNNQPTINNQDQYEQLIIDFTNKFWQDFIIALEDAIIEEEFYTKFENDYKNDLKVILEHTPTVGLAHNFLWQWRYDHNSKKLDKTDFEILSILCLEKQVNPNDFFYASAEYIAKEKNFSEVMQYRAQNTKIATFDKLDSKSVSNVKWQRDNKTEFVQLIYALYEAGYINNEESQKTKLVTQLSSLFNFDVGKHWQSNLTKSINDRNADYVPDIFQNLTKAFIEYRDKHVCSQTKVDFLLDSVS